MRPMWCENLAKESRASQGDRIMPFWTVLACKPMKHHRL